MLNDLADQRVRVEYVHMAGANKIRAWARRNGATVALSRYATDAYDGHVVIHSPWNEGANVAEAKAKVLRELLATL